MICHISRVGLMMKNPARTQLAAPFHQNIEDNMGIGIWELVIILAILLLLFGTKRLQTLGGDLGGAIRGFRSAMNEKDPDDRSGPGTQ
jgi:TatA/E family protein of Tat protein translocase